MAKADVVAICIFGLVLVGGFTIAMVLISAYGDIDPVEVTVDDASLEHMSLAVHGNATASLAYNLSPAVSVRNPNWAARAWRTAPLEAELRIAGQPFALIRLSGPEERERIRAGKSKAYRVATAADGVPVAIGVDGVAEFAVESAAGVFRLELIVAGEFKYQALSGRRAVIARCSLKLPLSTVAKAMAFAALEHTLPPQACMDISNMTKAN